MENLDQKPGTEGEPITRYDAVVVLGRGIGKDSYCKWRPLSYFVESSLHSGRFDNTVDPNAETSLVGGGNANTLALFHLYQELSEAGSRPKLVIFAAGRPGYLAGENPELSEGSVMETKFLSKLTHTGEGIPIPETTILGKNKNTADDMAQSLRIIKEKGLKNVAIITVDVHRERTGKFLKLARENAGIPEDAVHIDFISSESILMEASDKYKGKLGPTAQHAGYQQTVGYIKTEEMEKRGSRRLDEGTYFKTGPYATKTDKNS